ncbi:RNA-binding protein [Candidatus Woesearchaeota archaeon]|nr:RNA-binding protein [Candidatus Woesearchaeota archaeon]
MNKSKLKVSDNDIVVPGELLAQGMNYLPSHGTYRLKENILSSKLGLVRIDGKVIKLIPLSGKYLPKKGDVIIGKIKDINFSGWRVETNSAYVAMLSMKDASSDYIPKGADLTKYFEVGDFILTKITNVTSQNLIDLSMKGPGLKKLNSGRIVIIDPTKVPRIIGKRGSMVSMIKNSTKCNIIVGQNGVIWIKGEPEDEYIASEAIKIIEKESHVSGLTNRINEFIKSEKVK